MQSGSVGRARDGERALGAVFSGAAGQRLRARGAGRGGACHPGRGAGGRAGHGRALGEGGAVSPPEELAPAGGATPQAEVETWLQRALDVTPAEARSLELRAAMNLSRLWHQQGKWKEARDLLAEVYAWLTEGLDTADLQQTKVLLEELA